jgi:hypothetical protein
MSIRQDIDLTEGLWSGDDLVLDWYVTTGPAIEVAAAAAAGATSITVRPLRRALANGAKVRFGPEGMAGIVATLTAAAGYGATSLAVSALGGALQQGETGAEVQALTGWTLELTVTLPPASTVLLTKAVTLQDAANGQARAILTDTDTETALAGKSYHYRLRRTDADNERTLAYGTLALRTA